VTDVQVATNNAGDVLNF